MILIQKTVSSMNYIDKNIKDFCAVNVKNISLEYNGNQKGAKVHCRKGKRDCLKL